jgi:hypothetical protein
MSLYLPEQKLGSHSSEGSSSNKFMLKGRQTGSMHRGHSWVFRAESFETMSAWVCNSISPSIKKLSLRFRMASDFPQNHVLNPFLENVS